MFGLEDNVVCSTAVTQSLLITAVLFVITAGSLSRGGDFAVYVFDLNQPNLPTPFYSVLASISVFMALSTVFHSINSPDNSPFSHSVLLVFPLPWWSFKLYVSLSLYGPFNCI